MVDASAHEWVAMEVEAICQVLSEHGVKIASSTYYEWCDKLPSRTRARVKIFRFHDATSPSA